MNRRSLLALTYNDNSVLEQFHSSVAFFLLHHHHLLLPRPLHASKPAGARKRSSTKREEAAPSRRGDATAQTGTGETADGQGLEGGGEGEVLQERDEPEGEASLCDRIEREDSYRAFRKEVIELIVHTDMTKHFSLLALFKVKRQTGGLDIVNNEEDRSMLLKMLLKAADIGHATKTFDLHFFLSCCLIEEFHRARFVDPLSLGSTEVCQRRRRRAQGIPPGSKAFLPARAEGALPLESITLLLPSSLAVRNPDEAQKAATHACGAYRRFLGARRRERRTLMTKLGRDKEARLCLRLFPVRLCHAVEPSIRLTHAHAEFGWTAKRDVETKDKSQEASGPDSAGEAVCLQTTSPGWAIKQEPKTQLKPQAPPSRTVPSREGEKREKAEQGIEGRRRQARSVEVRRNSNSVRTNQRPESQGSPENGKRKRNQTKRGCVTGTSAKSVETTVDHLEQKRLLISLPLPLSVVLPCFKSVWRRFRKTKMLGR
ncbi:3'5'-cyclic nucleotide phosphodiesterase domain-containing protein [Neospora caninum Liverpool]|uniref:3'5'-cyclic nucleotide phosphodiesterase domain-containing protein n=1 Tax=Neospora caninum (strain Liverpool) TaxID=572307 RepID=F0VH58_NEOCL|nr:3'5'-cyclic nucleotide phosphodiesterase domain-containing protein [Neospora caninum Liverpool]CBZ53052.1 3'5'-cyclic nucleotide phosphodiesterase domain-containing protein [Neospora caninum Liverpool]|eukprot:XP_003883084.1 3'5'-cyclic nucleotide phosphodiesterase domain-containing protein [Neospora caninum Liverpool]